jgi:hypothetical protein
MPFKMVIFSEMEKFGIIWAVYLKFVFLYWPEYPRIMSRSMKKFGCPVEIPVGCHTIEISTGHCVIGFFFILPWLAHAQTNFVTFSVIGSFSKAYSIYTQ